MKYWKYSIKSYILFLPSTADLLCHSLWSDATIMGLNQNMCTLLLLCKTFYPLHLSKLLLRDNLVVSLYLHTASAFIKLFPDNVVDRSLSIYEKLCNFLKITASFTKCFCPECRDPSPTCTDKCKALTRNWEGVKVSCAEGLHFSSTIKKGLLIHKSWMSLKARDVDRPAP